MRTEKLPLRRFTAVEKQRVDNFYKYMALALLEAKDAMLARNQYVDQTIWDLLEAVHDDPKLLAAWKVWCETRDIDGLRWPVSQFRTEVDVALAAVAGFEISKARVALQGGAR
jgi:hypothetical protein